MQRIVYGFGQFSANTMHFRQIVYPRPCDALQSTELAQQLAPLRLACVAFSPCMVDDVLRRAGDDHLPSVGSSRLRR